MFSSKLRSWSVSEEQFFTETQKLKNLTDAQIIYIIYNLSRGWAPVPKKKWHANRKMCHILTSKRATRCHFFKLNEFQFWDRISAAFIEIHWNPRDFFCDFHSNLIKIIYNIYNIWYDIYLLSITRISTFILLYEYFNYPPTAAVFAAVFAMSLSIVSTVCNGFRPEYWTR